MALHRVGPVLFSTNVKDQVDYLKSKGLLRTQQDCAVCGVPMEWESRPILSDKFTWRCPICHARKSIRTESFFQNQN